MYYLRLLNLSISNQSHDIPHSDRQITNKSPSFNACYVLDIDNFRRLYMYLTAENNCVTKYHKGIDSKSER